MIRALRLSLMLLLLPLLGTLAPAAHALTIAGVEVPPTLHMGSQDLHLQGAGLRTRFFFDVYVAALYVPDRPATPAALLDPSSPRVLTLRLLRDVDAVKLGHALEDGLQANCTPAELDSLRPVIERLLAVMAEIRMAHKGSLVVLSLGSEGISVSFEGVERGRVQHPLLARALLRVWLGDHPAQESLKKALLGGF